MDKLSTVFYKINTPECSLKLKKKTVDVLDTRAEIFLAVFGPINEIKSREIRFSSLFFSWS